jgi:hypothetical protein
MVSLSVIEQGILIRNHSAASSEAEEYLAEQHVKVRVVVVDDPAVTLPVLVTGLGRFVGLERIKQYVQLEKNGFNKYASSLLSARTASQDVSETNLGQFP